MVRGTQFEATDDERNRAEELARPRVDRARGSKRRRVHGWRISLFQLGTIASLRIGLAAVLRAWRGGGGFASAITGLVLGGTLTLLWVVWIGMLILNPGALGD
jgi:hypothetical protein